MPDKSEAEVEADEIIDTFDELVRQRDELRAENERLRAAVLAYDDAIRDVAHLGQRWVRDDDKLDDLYAAMIAAAGRDIEA